MPESKNFLFSFAGLLNKLAFEVKDPYNFVSKNEGIV